jgi:hypothetical protein
MMNFLRKHQKKLFIVITVIIIISFTFFGTFSTMGAREIPDKKIGVAIDGSAIMERQLYAMVRFLSLGTNEVLKNDLMSTGLTTLLAEKYFEELKGDFQEKLDKTKRYTPYVHPQVPSLSADAVWSYFIPQLPRHLHEVRQGDLSPKTFAAYCDLYLDQVAFPPELLRRFLVSQQQQYNWISPDMGLADSRHLSLFGHQSFEEWFGVRFTELLGKFLFNAAAIAEEKGYKVSLDEARADLLRTCLQTISSIPSKQEATFADASEFLRLQVQMAGIDETEAAKVWKKVMLVHRLFNEVGQGVLVDPLSYHQFSSFADETATVEVYQLPEVLRVGDFRSLLKIQYYLDAIAPKSKKFNELPRQILSAEEVERKAPELVVSPYALEIAKTTKEEVGSRLTLKATWDFETGDAGWQKLTAAFPILAKGESASREERWAILEGIDPKLRLKIDRSARSALIDEHPEWIEEALSKAPAEKKAVAIRSKGSVAPFEEIEETSSLRGFLEKAVVGEAGPIFTQDGKTYYRIIVWEKPASKQVMTLKEALEGDWLGQLLDQKLEDAYADVRKKEPSLFKTDSGSWKSFSDVRNQVGTFVYADMLKQISDQPLAPDQYCVRRFAALMESAKKNIEAQGDESLFLKKGGDPLLDQWMLAKQTKEIKRSDATSLSKADMFAVPEGNWSSVSAPANGDLAFFRLLKKGTGQTAVAEKIVEGQRTLGMDARRLLMHQVLSRMDHAPR